MRLLYVTYPDYIFTSGLIWNQVLGLLQKISEKNKNTSVTLLSFVPFPEWIKRKSRLSVIEKQFPKVQLIVFPAFLKRNWILPLYPLFYFSTLLIAKRVLSKVEPNIIHTRGIIAGLIAHSIHKKIPWLLDMRGLFPEEGVELKFWKEESRSYKAWKRVEKGLLKSCSAVNFVSEKMQSHFQGLYPVEKGVLIPSGVDTEWFSPAAGGAKLDPLTLIYSGSTGWEDLESLKKIFQLFQQIKPNTRLLFLLPHTLKTKEQDKICRFFDKESVEIQWCWPEEVPNKLRQAHIGILTRQSSLVTQVMWPIKCIEYWSSGLPVVSTPEVTAVNYWIKEKGMGLLLSLESTEEDQCQIIEFLSHLKNKKEDVIEVARENFDINKTVEAYLSVYEKLSV